MEEKKKKKEKKKGGGDMSTLDNPSAIKPELLLRLYPSPPPGFSSSPSPTRNIETRDKKSAVSHLTSTHNMALQLA